MDTDNLIPRANLMLSIFILFVVSATNSDATSDVGNSRDVTEERIRSLEREMDIFEDPHREYEGYDGWYNNKANPSLGVTDSPLSRRLPISYPDGVYSMEATGKPNPFNITWNTMRGETGKPSFQGRTAFLTFFGQQVVDEIVNTRRAGCPVEYEYIDIPEWHEFRSNHPFRKTMPFVRTRYSPDTGVSPNVPRNQLNEHTPWIDGGIVYGTTKAWADKLRSFKGGRLADNEKEGEPQFPERNTIGLPMTNLPDPVEHKFRDAKRYFKLGNPHGAENPFLLTFGILWFRWHNYWADKFNQETDWSDERIYQEARKWVIGTYQKFVFYDWLPAFLGMTTEEMNEVKYTGYKAYILPMISHEFQAAAMRWGHTLVPPGVYKSHEFQAAAKGLGQILVPPGVYKRNETCHFLDLDGSKGVRTCNSYWNAEQYVREDGIESLIMGMTSQVTEREDNVIAVDLQRRVYGPLNFVRRDLMVETILRGRDHGLPDYNTAREALGLIRKESFFEINPHYNDSSMSAITETDLRNLEEAYQRNLDHVDIWSGGLFETTAKGPGELFSTIILDQFTRIRDGDRFWFENRRNRLFTKEQITYIHNLTLSDVIIRCTDISADAIQRDVFHFMQGDPCWDESVDTQRGGHGNENRTVSEFDMDNCTGLETYDYFTHSEVSFALTFAGCGVWIIGCIVALNTLGDWQTRQTHKKQKELHKRYSKVRVDTLLRRYEATEWRGYKQDPRPIQVTLGPGKMLQVLNAHGNKTLRQIDMSSIQQLTFCVSSDRHKRHVLIEVDKEYDLVMRFENEIRRVGFISDLRFWLEKPDIGIKAKQEERREKNLLKLAFTKEDRQKNIERFLRIAFAQVLHLDVDTDESQGINSAIADKPILAFELNKTEFAESLSMKPDSMFVTQMFALADKDQSGTLSLREFLDMLIIFVKGNAEDKMRLMFDMYDLDKSGELHRDEFRVMLKSMMAMVSASLEPAQLEECIDTMFTAAGFENKDELLVEDFILLMAEHKEDFSEAALKIPGEMKKKDNGKKGKSWYSKKLPKRQLTRKPSKIEYDVDVDRVRGHSIHAKLTRKLKTVFSFIENHRLHIFWLALYNLVLLLVFFERVYYFSTEREHKGLRRITGLGVSITRGAASAMMFTYSSLLVTMCRNIITKLRETFLHYFIPFDSALVMHKVIAYWALLFTVIHIIGHSFNFYHINTQPPEDLNCYFSDYFHRSHTLTNFHYWCWNTVTGLTGVLLVLVFAIIYTFATQFARRKAFRFFWITHKLYIVAYILTILHGSGRLVQAPFMWFFFLGPAILFTIDKMVSLTRKKRQIAVVKAELLPSDVTHLQFRKPSSFEYKSGQWVRIACTELGTLEYHPFTLSSAPHEEHLSLHIRAVGPWTINLRQAFDPVIVGDRPYPKLYLDGPYGEGHQDWWQFEVSVLVGGGIGVTPFSSILKDIANMSSTQQRLKCKKVYFIWVTRSQKHFEWLVDIIREVEIEDTNNLVSIHLFITQFYEQFDLRTTMLYVCERHFQKISDRSLFTGLRSPTHFGRPNFTSFLTSLEKKYPQVDRIGVFSCGPPGMTGSVEKACVDLNKRDETAFIHHYENF